MPISHPDKRDARRVVKTRLKAAGPHDLEAQSREICRLVLDAPAVRRARRVVAYLACQRLREVETTPLVEELLARGVRLYLPKVRDLDSNMAMLHCASLEGLRPAPPFDILEPDDAYEDGDRREDVVLDGVVPDVVILPGLAFDGSGGRLGRGGGYYDKFLADLEEVWVRQGAKRPALLGVAFREQLVETVPVQEHDKRCDGVVTADGVKWFSENRP